ncbi:MAG: V-type ATP synthase subunit I [Spirochaetales bacterium]|nr:V-type ATP synthase subunit I [Spirochaetales bacterium]
MKKVSLVVLNSGKEASLRKLKRLGVVHLEKLTGAGEKLKNLEEKRAFLEKSLYTLPDIQKDTPAHDYVGLEESLKAAEKIDNLASELAGIRDRNTFYNKELERVSVFGEFDPAEIAALGEKGIKVLLYQISKDDMESFPMDNAFILARTKVGMTLAYVARGSEKLPENLPVEIPELSPFEMRTALKNNIDRIAEIEKELQELAGFSVPLKTAMAVMDDEVEFENVYSGMGAEDELAYLTGFCPDDKIDVIKSYSAKNGWALLVKDPEEEEQPPTQLKNNRLVRLIQPLLDILGLVPGYREFDISIWFLFFFTIFFAMIIGDAAYGSIFLVLCVIVTIKIKSLPDGLKLFYILSIATIIWGGVTGSWFGSPTLAALPFFKQFIYEPISNFNPLSGETIKMMCFIIGTVHLVLAHFKAIIKKIPSLLAVADLGWLVMILGLYYLVLNLVIDPDKYPMPPYAVYMIGGGLGLLIIFGQQKKGQNFFKGILMGVAGLFTTFLDSISAFSDIISYIRLYAVGLATLAISQSFNSMAAGVGGGPGIIAAALILLLGHGLNIAMAMLSVVVHGVRLNVLEFSSHLGMEWSGIKYEPFMEASLPAGNAEIRVEETENSI